MSETDFDPMADRVISIPSPFGELALIGGDDCGGSYVLRIRLSRMETVVFGHFKGGKRIPLIPGDYAYIGSAMSDAGAVCLARRLVRHASRFGDGRPHPIRRLMLTEFPTRGLGSGDLTPQNGKHAKWNIDHLLELPSSKLIGAYLVRTTLNLEEEIGRMIQTDPAAVVFERGLGANDYPGGTHLLRIDANDRWWRNLPGKLVDLLRRNAA